jgi:predicted DCC family thiol-disulfide oxidoreductase YuxK
MSYIVIYDGLCNLCVGLVQLLEQLDRGQRFRYVTMQDTATLSQWGITQDDCEMGMILIKSDRPEQRWQGSAAAEEIGCLMPFGTIFVEAYRSLPGVKSIGDRTYGYVRDNRYQLFGRRSQIYQSSHPTCESNDCRIGT